MLPTEGVGSSPEANACIQCVRLLRLALARERCDGVTSYDKDSFDSVFFFLFFFSSAFVLRNIHVGKDAVPVGPDLD